jgi:hypothetical protein
MKFRIERLEDRIAPCTMVCGCGHNNQGDMCNVGNKCSPVPCSPPSCPPPPCPPQMCLPPPCPPQMCVPTPCGLGNMLRDLCC